MFIQIRKKILSTLQDALRIAFGAIETVYSFAYEWLGDRYVRLLEEEEKAKTATTPEDYRDSISCNPGNYADFE